MNRFQVAQNIALGATIASLVGFLIVAIGLDLGVWIMAIGFLGGIVSYFFGGFWTAVKMASKIATWGWFVVRFPYDILTFFLAFIASIIVFAFLPIIPVRKAYNESTYK